MPGAHRCRIRWVRNAGNKVHSLISGRECALCALTASATQFWSTSAFPTIGCRPKKEALSRGFYFYRDAPAPHATAETHTQYCADRFHYALGREIRWPTDALGEKILTHHATRATEGGTVDHECARQSVSNLWLRPRK